ncbi:hypothetical protein P12x_001204 [Tundrisphaera lichenicola]|uniref:hypothetical protein n=1 Tax=Tundrisphaera lichenicola TaxID=2029860 RepID=UPI003EC03A09
MALERTLVQIRERPLVEILDLALAVIRSRPLTLGLAALAGIAPFVVLNDLLFRALGNESAGISLFLWLLEAPIATAPLTVVLGKLMFDRNVSINLVASTLVRSAVPLIVINGFLRIVLFFLIPSRLAFANEVILLEGGRWWSIIRRGGDLCSGRAGELFLLGWLQILLVYTFATLSYLGTGRIVQVFMAEDLTWDLPGQSVFDSLRFQIPVWLVAAFFGVVRFLTYIDQRIRLEGWEVELRLRSVSRTIREDRRW